MPVSYNICPLTGLSYSIKDDYQATYFHGAKHPITEHPKELFHMIEKRSFKIPKSYIAAGIFLQLEQENLIVYTKHETRFCRGQANEMLCSFNYAELIDLYWAARNTKAALCSEPLTVNLATCVEQGRNTLYDNLKAVAAQNVSAADMKVYIRSRTTIQGTIHKGARKVRLDRLDIISCLKRCKKDLPILYADLKDQGLELEFPASSAKKAASFLYHPRGGAVYQSLDKKVKDRILVIMDCIYQIAIHEALIDMDGLQAKSYEIVKTHIKEELKPLALDEVEF